MPEKGSMLVEGWNAWKRSPSPFLFGCVVAHGRDEVHVFQREISMYVVERGKGLVLAGFCWGSSALGAGTRFVRARMSSLA